MPDNKIPVILLTARNTTERYLRGRDALAQLKQDLVTDGIEAGYSKAIRAACPELDSGFYAQLVPLVRRAVRARRRVPA